MPGRGWAAGDAEGAGADGARGAIRGRSVERGPCHSAVGRAGTGERDCEPGVDAAAHKPEEERQDGGAPEGPGEEAERVRVAEQSGVEGGGAETVSEWIASARAAYGWSGMQRTCEVCGFIPWPLRLSGSESPY